MKLPFKPIVILVILSLTGIFAYQTYWITGLYHTMRTDMEQGIVEAMRVSDYNEMMLRVNIMQKSNNQHGHVEVSTGYHDGNKAFVRSNAILDKNDTTAHNGDSIRIQTTSYADTLTYESVSKDTLIEDSAQSALYVSKGLGLILNDQNSMKELTNYFQRGLHAGLDVISDPNISHYDSLLTIQLKERGIVLPHRLEYLHTGKIATTGEVYIDTLVTTGTVGYVPSPKARQYEYIFDINDHHIYRLTLEPIYMVVLRQMSGILVTSFIILIILGFSFWFLVRTILRQKTLEEMKSDFTNNITHELKTPIAVAYAANDALLNFKQAEDKNKRDKYLRICQEQLQQLSGMVEQILAMSMEKRKSFRLHTEVLSLQKVFAPLIEQHKLKADKPVLFNMSIEPEELTIVADPAHFSNILSNLIDNAIKYSFDKVEIDIHCRKCESNGRKLIEISITDCGIGIPADKQALIFDKFYRVPTGNVHNTKGYGLGLFYVKTMVEKHGGSISITSIPGQGSKFTILFSTE